LPSLAIPQGKTVMPISIATPPTAPPRVRSLSLAAAIGLVIMVAACSKPEAAAPATTAPATAAAAKPAAAAPAAAVNSAAAIAAMTPEQLRDAARKATSEDRMFAPAGDNAMEYYLALRAKQPGDATVSSAITDTLPFVVIGTEQSVSKENFDEAKRLYAMVQQADPHAPALPRLQAAILAGEQAQAKRLAAQATTAVEQQAAQQKAAQLAAQQKAEADRTAAAAAAAQQQQQVAAQQAAQQKAAQLAAQQKADADRRAEQQRQQQAAAAAKAKAVPTAADLVAISTPPPKFPPEALRSGDSGQVLVEFTVGPDGSVSSARVVGGDGRVFGRAALEAVKRWRFQPLGASITTRRPISFNAGG
jgi:protein TonB